MTGDAPSGWHLLVCVNERLRPDAPSCGARGGVRLVATLEAALVARGLALPVEPIYCFGYCSDGPNVRLAPGGPFFTRVDAAELPGLLDAVERHLAGAAPAGD